MSLLRLLLIGGLLLLACGARAVDSVCPAIDIVPDQPLSFGLLRYTPGLRSGWVRVDADGTFYLSRGLSLGDRSVPAPARFSLRGPPGRRLRLVLSRRDANTPDGAAFVDVALSRLTVLGVGVVELDLPFTLELPPLADTSRIRRELRVGADLLLRRPDPRARRDWKTELELRCLALE